MATGRELPLMQGEPTKGESAGGDATSGAPRAVRPAGIRRVRRMTSRDRIVVV